MDTNFSAHFDKYHTLKSEIDRRADYLADSHIKHIYCKKGCDMCCMDYSIFPIEFYSILNELKQNKIRPELKNNDSKVVCDFLQNSSCTIYNHRPIICRTHGLPLLYANDEGDWELSACELNFTDFDFQEFEMENTFPQDKYNSKLFLLNKDFIKDFKDRKFSEFDLIPIRELKDLL